MESHGAGANGRDGHGGSAGGEASLAAGLSCRGDTSPEHATAFDTAAFDAAAEHAAAFDTAAEHASAFDTAAEHASAEHASAFDAATKHHAAMSERHKYQGIYGEPEKFPRYGHCNHGAALLPWVVRQAPASVLDVGCGFNEFKRALLEQLPATRCVGVDFACPGADMQADATRLPFADKEFTLVTAFDMLEHVLPEEVDTVLAELARVSESFAFSISYRDSVNRWQGQTLHPTVQPESWWIARLMRAGAVGLSHRGHYLCGRWQPRLPIRTDEPVLLVGNGPSLIDGRLGAQIDSHAHVVRFNGWTVDGFERDAGTRTTLWWRTGGEKARTAQVPEMFLHEHGRRVTPGAWVLPAMSYNRCRAFVQERALVQSCFQRDVTALLATSGFQAAWWFLLVMGVKEVLLAGFDHFDKSRTWQHHYYEPNRYTKPPDHDGDLERAIFGEWVKAGRVRYLIP